MRITTIAATFLGLATSFTSLVNAQTPVEGLATAIRKEVREMSEEEWTTYANAIKLVQASGFWQTMADIHAVNFQTGIHNNPMFFPWHRAYLRMMEEELSTVAGTTVTIPYWDWTLDSADMNGSPIFGDDRFGGFSIDNSGCVIDGPFTTLTTPTSPIGDVCLRRGREYRGRGYDRCAVLRSFRTWWGTYWGNWGYDTVRGNIESIHNSVHASIGGHMGRASSPLDPIFWSHHMMIDNLWSVWQSRSPWNVRAFQGDTDAALNDLPGWTVADTFDIRPFKPLEDQQAAIVATASLSASRASEGTKPVSTASESVATLKLLESMHGKQLIQIPRTCPAPQRNDDNDLFWDAEREEPIIAEMEARYELAQALGLAETHDCLASPEVIQLLIAANVIPAEESKNGSGLGVAEGAGIAAGCVGLFAVVAAVVVSKRRQQGGVSSEVPQQQQVAPGVAVEL